MSFIFQSLCHLHTVCCRRLSVNWCAADGDALTAKVIFIARHLNWRSFRLIKTNHQIKAQDSSDSSWANKRKISENIMVRALMLLSRLLEKKLHENKKRNKANEWMEEINRRREKVVWGSTQSEMVLPWIIYKVCVRLRTRELLREVCMCVGKRNGNEAKLQIPS